MGKDLGRMISISFWVSHPQAYDGAQAQSSIRVAYTADAEPADDDQICVVTTARWDKHTE